jgi:CheY-like chemotaxis protein
MKIMVIEDEPVSLKLACVVLQAEGHRVQYAETAESALELIKLDRPDVLLLDLALPDMDGLELAAHLKQDPDTRDIPVDI